MSSIASLSNLLLLSGYEFINQYHYFMAHQKKLMSDVNSYVVREIHKRYESIDIMKEIELMAVPPASNTGVNFVTPLTAAHLDYLSITFTQDYFGISIDKKDNS